MEGGRGKREGTYLEGRRDEGVGGCICRGGGRGRGICRGSRWSVDGCLAAHRDTGGGGGSSGRGGLRGSGGGGGWTARGGTGSSSWGRGGPYSSSRGGPGRRSASTRASPSTRGNATSPRHQLGLLLSHATTTHLLLLGFIHDGLNATHEKKDINNGLSLEDPGRTQVNVGGHRTTH